jgi:hypothetical protein
MVARIIETSRTSIFPQVILSATAAPEAIVIAVVIPISWSPRVGPGITRSIAKPARKIRQITAKSQESIMVYINVWRIGIYQSSRSCRIPA